MRSLAVLFFLFRFILKTGIHCTKSGRREVYCTNQCRHDKFWQLGVFRDDLRVDYFVSVCEKVHWRRKYVRGATSRYSGAGIGNYRFFYWKLITRKAANVHEPFPSAVRDRGRICADCMKTHDVRGKWLNEIYKFLEVHVRVGKISYHSFFHGF